MKRKAIFTITIIVLFSVIGCTSKTLSTDNYHKAIQQLCEDSNFRTRVMSYLQKDPLGFFVVGLHSSNMEIFKDGTPKCDLSDTNNVCFKSFVKVEAILYIAKEQEILINPAPFYEWREAVLNGNNIQTYLEELLDQNFIPLS